MSIRDEDLIAYLLDEGDAELVRRVEAALEIDSEVVERLGELRAALGMLDSLKAAIEPPADLVSRTLNFIDDSAVVVPASSSQSGESLVRLRPSESVGNARSRQSAWDSAFLTVSIAAMACLMLPLMLQGRSLSRQIQCADNLRAVGQGLTQIAMLDAEHRFPAIPGFGHEAFAGRYVLKLKDHGLIDSCGRLRCVSLPGSDSAGPKVIFLPTTQEFLSADAAQQAWWRGQLGGNYAYNFGVIENGRIVGPKLEGRTQFAILADAPQIEDDRDVFYAHEGRGINIFYEDGHVGFSSLPRCPLAEPSDSLPAPVPTAASKHKTVLRSADWSAAVDYPFRNLAGQQAYGLHFNDAALGPSPSAPKP